MPQAIRGTRPRRARSPRQVGPSPDRPHQPPGWGSSGDYSASVLETASREWVFPAGTPMFLDHETESEKFDRPKATDTSAAAARVETITGSRLRPDPSAVPARSTR